MALPSNISDREKQKFIDLEAGKSQVLVSSDFTGIRGAVYRGVVFGASMTANLASTGTDNPLFQFKNPVGSGVYAVIWRVRVGVVTASRSSVFKEWSQATVTNDGTLLDKSNCNSNFYGTAPACEIYSLPTATFESPAVAYDTFVVEIGSAAYNMISDFETILYPGSTLVITGNPSSNNTVASIGIRWLEEAI